MNGSLRAALVLTLKDELTGGLERMKGVMSGIRELGSSLTLGRLGQEGGDVLRNLSTEARGLGGHLKAIVTSADGARAALGRMGAATAKWGRSTFGEASHMGAIGTVVSGTTVAAPIMQYASWEDQLRHIAITEGLRGAAVGPEVKRLNSRIDKEALAGSQSSESVAAAYYGLQTGGAGTRSQVEEALSAHTRAATAYRIDPEAFTPVTLALMKNFKIFGDDLGRSLAAVGQASKEGQMKVTDFALTLPQVAGAMNTQGLTGFKNANLAIAGLQTIRTDVGEAGQAGTDFAEMVRSMYSNQGMKGFALAGKGMTGKGFSGILAERARALMMKATGTGGLDVTKIIDDGAKKGIGPIDAVLGRLEQIKSKLNAHEFSDLLNQMFTNQEALKGWQAMLNHMDQFKALRAELDAINANKVTTDFQTGSAGPEAAVRRAEEGGTQVTRRLGEGFAPLLTPVNAALQGILSLTDQLDTKLPGLGNAVLVVAGGVLSLAAAAGAIGFVWPAVVGGFGVLSGVASVVWTGLTYVLAALEGIVPALAAIAGVSVGVVAAVLVLVAVFVAAAYDIYENWAEFRGFFMELWDGIKNIFGGFLEFLGALWSGNLTGVIAGLRQMWTGLGQFFGGLWGIIRTLFIDFGKWVDGWTGGAMTATVNAIKGAWNGLTGWFANLWADIRKPFDNFVTAILNSPVAHLLGLHAASQLAGPRAAAAGAASGDAGDGATAPGLTAPVAQFQGKMLVGVDPKNGQIGITHTETSTPGFSIWNNMLDAGLVAGLQ